MSRSHLCVCCSFYHLCISDLVVCSDADLPCLLDSICKCQFNAYGTGKRARKSSGPEPAAKRHGSGAAHAGYAQTETLRPLRRSKGRRRQQSPVEPRSQLLQPTAITTRPRSRAEAGTAPLRGRAPRRVPLRLPIRLQCHWIPTRGLLPAVRDLADPGNRGGRGAAGLVVAERRISIRRWRRAEGRRLRGVQNLACGGSWWCARCMHKAQPLLPRDSAAAAAEEAKRKVKVRSSTFLLPNLLPVSPLSPSLPPPLLLL